MLHTVLDIVKNTKSIIMDKTKQEAITVKGYGDYVTEVDFSIQKYLKETLFTLYPHIQFMGEEGDGDEIQFENPYWILDPIDGTANLTHHLNQSAVSLGLVQNHAVVLGVVYNPFTDELFYAEKNKGAFKNGEKISVSSTKTLHDSMIHMGTAPYHKDLVEETIAIAGALLAGCQDLRRSGSAAIDLCHVAAGHSDGFYESILKPWDYAASVIILEEAGGKITNYDCKSPSLTGPDSIIASNGTIHTELYSVIKQNLKK